MKKLLLIIALLSSQAFAKTIAEYDFAKSSMRSTAKYKVQIDEEGFVRVRKIESFTRQSRYIFPDHGDDFTNDIQAKLSEELVSELKRRIKHLASAEIVEEMNFRMCRMFAPVSARIDLLKVKRLNDQGEEVLKKVDGPKGCWVKERIHPKDEWSQKIVAELKVMMKTIALIKE